MTAALKIEILADPEAVSRRSAAWIAESAGQALAMPVEDADLDAAAESYGRLLVDRAASSLLERQP